MASRENTLSNKHSIASVLSVHLPKYGTRIPNRIFVGGLTGDTTELELKQFFAAYGSVRDCKIILDRGGVSKSYGFVTFDNQEDADRILRKESENLLFKDRKLNIGQAIRKQQAFQKTYEACLSPAASSVSSYSALPGIQYHTVSTGPSARFMLYCTPDGDNVMVPTTAQNQGMTLPMMMSPQTYNPQMGSAYYHQSPACGIPSQWIPANQWRYDVQHIPMNSSVYPTSPYLYPVHAAMVSQESHYPAHMAVPAPEQSNSSGSLVDQGEQCQYYIGVPPQYSSPVLC